MAKAEKRELAGQTFGRWTVLDDLIVTAKGERKWLCRCTCGTERFVLEKSLLSDKSLSCGCLRQEKAAAVNTRELTGQTFGELTVLGRAENQDRNGGIWWRCRCACGAEYEAPATLLLTGKRTHCAARVHGGHYAYADITGQRFGRLTALFATDKRSNKRSVVWHCRCDCGNEVDYSYNELMYANLQSCGCRKKEHGQVLSNFLTHVAGTSVDMLRSTKLPSNNTTGVRGVYWIRGKYVAKIVFQKKQYFLGSYDNIEAAAAARREGERIFRDDVVSYYDAWQLRANEDAAWAEANPIRIMVRHDGDGFCLDIQPDLSR